MTISLAIHPREGSFSDRWIERAALRGIPYRLVDPFSTRIIDELRAHQAFLWHWVYWDRPSQLIARQLVRSAEELGLLVFPSTETCWTYDDKVAQKYHLEALGAPLARTDCFYSEAAALAWVATASFPRVAKLRSGAGSDNVRLLRTREEAMQYVRQAFGRGFSSVPGALEDAKKLIRTRGRGRPLDLARLLRLPGKALAKLRYIQQFERERGYVYFQEFLPGNAYDVRVSVIGDRAFAFSRNVRPNDFRASGSGSLDYSPERIRPECIRIAFDVARKLRSQSAAFDFAFDPQGEPKILEVSYCYVTKYVHACPGHWNPELSFVPGQMWPEDAIFDDVVSSLERSGR